MEHLERIALYLRHGDDDSAIDRTAALAERHDAAVEIVDVVPQAPWYARLVGNDSATLTRQAIGAREQVIRHTLAPRPDLMARARISVLAGEPWIELIQLALRQHVDLFVTTGHGRGGDLLGRTEAQLLRKAPCPVWILRPKERKRWKRVLVAVKPEPDNPVGIELSRRLLDAASRLAIDEGAELHVLRVWGSRLERVLARRMRPDRWEAVRTQLRADVLDQLLGLIEPWHDQIGGRVWLRQGDPETVIPAFAEKKKIDVLVIGTVARSGLEGVFIGNVAERVFQSVHCSILALKPEGFVGPVKLGE